MSTSIRENLQAELDKRGWNPYDLERTSGVPQPTIARFLSGHHNEPRGETVRKLAAGLGITEAELRGIAVKNDSTTIPHDISDQIRLDNLESLKKEPGLPWKKIGVDPAYLSEFRRKLTDRNTGNDLARRLEIEFHKPKGWMDQLHDKDDIERITITDTLPERQLYIELQEIKAQLKEINALLTASLLDK